MSWKTFSAFWQFCLIFRWTCKAKERDHTYALWGYLNFKMIAFLWSCHQATRTVVRRSSVGDFTFLQGSLTFQNLPKLRWFIVFHISIWGRLELCLRGLSPPKPPLPRRNGIILYVPHFLSLFFAMTAKIRSWRFKIRAFWTFLVI